MWRKHPVQSCFSLMVLLSILLFMPSPKIFAKGNFERIEVRGGGLARPVEIAEPALLGFFSFSEFYKMEIDPPQVSGEGYEILRYEGQGPSAWDHLRYYPNAKGTGGYVFYEGLLNGASEYDGKWYVASQAGDAAFRRVLANQAAGPSSTINFYLLVTVLVLVALVSDGLGFGWHFRQRVSSHRVARAW